MNARLLLLVLIAMIAPALAKNAGDYFHGASYKYVAGKRQDALLEVQEGLRKFPDDPRLKGLAEQLRKLDDQDDKDKNSGPNDPDKKDKDKKDPNKDPGKDKDKDKKEDEKNKDKDEGKDKQDKPQPPRDPKDDGKDGKNPPGARPGEMSKEEAQRLLNSFAEDEKKEQRERQKLMHKRLETEQDW